jgi:hypothetical protein
LTVCEPLGGSQRVTTGPVERVLAASSPAGHLL